ncbi:N-acetyl-gamma-glutamyl-phosphate reductase [Fructobacillus pseudoficulneus]|uniref:N-acetyl-gamma-glutamyl-phosphate reductase n=1 Tax=Fructobacillus pseudoficulneus TaxID=220714 RepID=A0A3F3GTV7_9LACO|nr:N-acetyl-gamma-glutamyl-phosphate reductase [Fructobacillus pseudoficulneus]GAP02891.1 N-acetyl-gamma-glutamyl-phosphate reductase [Fructobacillus pseudoficulneus]SEH45397.1 N-acetyl-gamma-glutamyl-phosphate reductase [Fructobacillus pseudoficulneus]
MNAAISGVTGYAGMQLYALLQEHPEIETINVYQHDLEDAIPLIELNPRLHLTSPQLAYPYDSQAIMDDNDLIFFATPAGVTSELADPYLAADFPVIDLSGDFRLKDPIEYQKWYKKTPADQAALSAAYYGLTDIYENPGARYVANPGCYATATLLGLAPAVMCDLIEPDSIVVDAKSGLSGAGKALTQSAHFSQANENLQVYKANQHKHIPEILAELKKWNPKVKQLQFMTTLVPIDRGIMSTIYAKVKPGVTSNTVLAHYHDLYKDNPFIEVTGETLPDIKAVLGTNDCKIGLVLNPTTGYLMIVSVIDNMLKGAAGQAVQNMNQLFNFPVTTGLALTPVAF